MVDPATNWAAVCGSNAVFVGITARRDFDAISLPVTEFRQSDLSRSMLMKVVEQAGFMVVLQHWIAAPAPP